MQQPNNTVTFTMIKNICYSLITVNANLILLAIALGSIAQEVTAVVLHPSTFPPEKYQDVIFNKFTGWLSLNMC